MPVEHKNITDPDIHEVKGAGTASAGQVLTGVGDGTSEFRDSIITTHGEMLISSNTTALSLTAAADATLATDSQYVKITDTGLWSAGLLENITFNVDELVVPVSGNYEISFWSSVAIATNGAYVGIKFAVNDTTPYSSEKVTSTAIAAGATNNMTFHTLKSSLSANDTISMYVASDTNTDVTFKEAVLIVKLLDSA